MLSSGEGSKGNVLKCSLLSKMQGRGERKGIIQGKREEGTQTGVKVSWGINQKKGRCEEILETLCLEVRNFKRR